MQKKIENESVMLYQRKGQFVSGVIGDVISLVLGVGVAVVLLIFLSALSGQTYQLVEADIDGITNTTIKNSVKTTIVSGFTAFEQTGNYMPLVVLALVIGLVLSVILGVASFGGRGVGGGGAL